MGPTEEYEARERLLLATLNLVRARSYRDLAPEDPNGDDDVEHAIEEMGEAAQNYVEILNKDVKGN